VTTTEPRRRVVEWVDPVQVLSENADLSGIDLLRAVADGILPMPPIASLMGFSRLTIEHGEASIAFTPAEYHYNPVGATQGGVAATALDAAMWCAVQSTLPALMICQTLDISVRYVRPMSAETGEVTARAHVVHNGSTVATASSEIRDGEGKLYADATMTSLRLKLGSREG
jgi:uncharacterized protein (TIGR00369 family)